MKTVTTPRLIVVRMTQAVNKVEVEHEVTISATLARCRDQVITEYLCKDSCRWINTKLFIINLVIMFHTSQIIPHKC